MLNIPTLKVAMSVPLRIATFNLENLDDKPEDRLPILRSQLLRLQADILCLQEIHGQEEPGQPRQLLALQNLLEGTPYAAYQQAATLTTQGQVYDERNLVILSRFAIVNFQQYRHQFAPAPSYRPVTANPPETEAKEVSWERPILHAQIQLPDDRLLDVLNLHLKSKRPTEISGQKIDNYTWKTASAWAEGFFISSMKRVGQALEARILLDRLFDAREDALIVVCGDFNADLDEVPVEAICGKLENTNNDRLIQRVLLPCEKTVPESSRYSYLHQGQKKLLDHLLISRSLLANYRSAEIHNELLHDESIAFATDRLYPESDHAPIVAELEI
jgi:predicted extracellular nuclease